MKIICVIKITVEYLLKMIINTFKTMIGPIKQLYEKDGDEFKPIQACDCTGSEGGSGGGSLPDSISAQASAYNAENATAEASVNPSTGLFLFKFGLPRGLQGLPGAPGNDGRDGRDGIDGDTPVAHKSVIAFKSSKTTPDTPVGGSWDVATDTITYPIGWSNTDGVEKPVWMSVGEFTSAAPNNPTWSKPIMISGEDGANGVDGVAAEFIYKLTKTSLDIPEKPESVNETEHVPEGWEDSPTGISEEMQVEWVCTRKKEDNGNWGDWQGPTIWSKWGANGIDGDGVEYIYRRNNGEVLDNPTPDDITTDEYQEKGEYEGIEYIPTDWFDNPQGVNEAFTHEWVCVRKSKNGVWGAFSNPALWAKFGEKGNNGISIRTMYAKTSGSDDVPVFVADNINPGSIWGLIIPTHESPEAVWSIQAYVTYDNKLAEVTLDDGTTVYGWQGPLLITGTAGVDGTPVNYKTYVYKLSDTKPEKPTSDDPANPGDGWLDYPNTTGQWWQCIGSVNGVTGLVTEWSEVLPVNGQDGVAQDGKRVEFRFAVSTSSTEAPALDAAIRQPNGWTTNPPAKAINEYMWMITATINPDDTLATNWSTPVLISGEQGPQGDTGPAGPVGPMGPSGISGIPGVAIDVRYCLGTEDSYDATYNSTVANDIDPVEYGWSATIPKVTEEKLYIWCIQTKYVYERSESDSDVFTKVLENPWSEPFRLNGINGIDGKGVGISSVDEYYLVSDKNSGITTSSTGWVKNSIPDFTDDKIYLWNYEVINYEDGTSAEPTAPAIIGTKGADGRGIVSITEKYLASAKTSDVTSTTSGWSTTVPATTKDTPYLWNWEHILYTDGTYDDFYAIIGSRGADGTAGGAGQIIYPAGVYDVNKSYTTDAQKAPYVFDPSDGNYYVMNYIGTWKGTEQNNYSPSQSYVANGTKYWTLMEAYDAIYANIGVIANGLIGSAVFNGNYMFSQQGITASGATTSAYENFNTSDPYNSSNSFRPNLCLNLVSGEAWFGAGAIHLYKDGTGAISMSSGYDQEAMGTLGTFITQNKLEFANAAVRLRVGDEYQDKGVFALSSAVTDSDGGATEKIIINVFADGSGYIGQNQEIYWGTDGVIHIGGLKITEEGIGTDTDGPLSKSVFIGKNGIISAGTTTTELVGSVNYQRINTLRYDGNSLSIESTGTASDGGNPGFSNLVYFRFENIIFKVTRFGIEGSKDGGNTWVDLLESGGSSSGGNVEFVDSLPSNPDSNKLYVLI